MRSAIKARRRDYTYAKLKNSIDKLCDVHWFVMERFIM